VSGGGGLLGVGDLASGGGFGGSSTLVRSTWLYMDSLSVSYFGVAPVFVPPS